MRHHATEKRAREPREATVKTAPREALLALMCMSGAQTGHELPLPLDRPFILGRSRQADIKLEDEMASRQHTKVVYAGGRFQVEDMGSKNGTYLNGHKLTGPSALKSGDYIRIGDTSFHVIQPCVVEEKAKDWWEKTQYTLATMKAQTERHAGAASVISGSLIEVTLLDLLQLLANSMKTGLVTIRCHQDKGDVYLRQGQIYYACINNVASLRPDKVMYRILRWKDGTFTFVPGAEHLVENEITEPTGSLLLEGVRQMDELSAFESVLPSLSAELRLAFPLPEPLRNLSPEELDLVQLVIEQVTLLKVLDAFPGSDLDAVVVLAGLLNRKILAVAEAKPPVEADNEAKQ